MKDCVSYSDKLSTGSYRDDYQYEYYYPATGSLTGRAFTANVQVDAGAIEVWTGSACVSALELAMSGIMVVTSHALRPDCQWRASGPRPAGPGDRHGHGHGVQCRR